MPILSGSKGLYCAHRFSHLAPYIWSPDVVSPRLKSSSHMGNLAAANIQAQHSILPIIKQALRIHCGSLVAMNQPPISFELYINIAVRSNQLPRTASVPPQPDPRQYTIVITQERVYTPQARQLSYCTVPHPCGFLLQTLSRYV
jgi:hypothetical protein